MSDALDAMFSNIDRANNSDVSNALVAPAQPVQNKPDALDTMFANIDRATSSVATTNLLNAQGSNPDNEAKALQLSKQNGVPQPAIAADLSGYQQQAELKKNVDILDQNPKLAGFVADNPLAARIAQDDFDKLGFLEKTITALSSGANNAILGNKLGRLGNVKQAAGLTGEATPQTDQQIQNINQAMQASPHLIGGFGFAQNFTGFISGLVDNAINGGMTGATAGAAAGAVAGASAGGVGALPGAGVGFAIGGGVGFNADMARVAAGNAYLKMSAMRGTDGQPMSESAKQFGSIFTGAATYAIGSYGTAVESKLFGQTADALADKAIMQAMTRPTFTKALSSFATETGKGAAQGAGIMTAMEASSIIGEQIGKAFSDGHFDTNPDEIVGRLEDAALNGAVMLGASHMAMHGLGVYGDFKAANRSEANMQMFKNLQDGTTDSKLHDRDQQAFQDFMQKQTNGTPVENIYIPAEKIREFYQTIQGKSEVDPFGFVPDMQQQLAEAHNTGGDVVIPTADYLTHLAGTPIADHLLHDIRVGANAMSVNEAKAFNAEFQERLQAATEVIAKQAEEKSPTQGIYDDVKQQAMNAGVPENEAKQGAAIYASRYAARAERMGVDPAEAYKKSGIEINNGSLDQGGKQFNQADIADKNALKTTLPLDLFDNATTIHIEAPKLTEKEVHESEQLFLSAHPENATTYRRSSGLLKRIRLASDTAIHELGGSAEAKRVVEKPLGPFSGYRISAEALSGDSFNPEGRLEVHVFGKEQTDAGVTKEPALTFTVGKDGELTVNGPSPSGETFNEFKNRGWADLAKGSDGEVQAGWTALTDPKTPGKPLPLSQLVPLLADVHARVREWRMEDHVGLHWDRSTGALGSLSSDASPTAIFFQPRDGATSRAKIQFKDGKSLISLLKDANASSLIHETGHLWLEELIHDAGMDGAPQQIKDDLNIIMKWMGVDSPDKIGVDQHEMFARAVEAYLMEGKAPSLALAGAFSRFKTWITKIYQNVANLNTPINDDIRGVFDRLLATDSEIEQAKETQGLKPAFKSKEDAGMTTAEWKSYTGAIDRANAQAESFMLDKMMAKVRRQRTAEYKDALKDEKEKAASEIDKRPDIQALNLLTKNQLPDGSKSETPLKLSRQAVEDTYGKKGVTDLPKGVTAADGTHPDNVAEMLGYSSGDAMIKDLHALEQQQRDARLQDGEKRGIRQILIDQEATKQMDAKHGDIADPQSMQDEAMAAIHSEKQTELLATELRYLKRMGTQALVERGQGRKAVKEVQTKADWDAAEADLMNQIKEAKTQAQIDKLNQKLADLNMENRWNDAERNTTQAALKEATVITKPMLDAIRAHVMTILEDKSVSDIGNFNKYARDERKAAREVQQAILKKDWNEAANAKQRQILSNILYVKAKEASGYIDRDQSMMARLAAKKTFKTISQEFVNQIHDLIGRFGFDSGRGEELQRTKKGTLEDFVNQQSAEHGIELAVDQSLFNAAGGRVDALKYSKFKSLAMAVRSMQEVGKSDMMIEVDGVKRDFNDIKNQVVDQIRSFAELHKSEYLNPKSAPIMERKKEALFSAFRSADAALTKKESLFDQIDRNDHLGIMNTAIMRKLKDAEHNRNIWSEQSANDFKAAADAMPKDWMKKLRDILPDDKSLIDPETGRPFKIARKDMLGMMLNWGNEGNIKRLVDGFKWNEQSVKAFLDKHATKDDWDFAQKIWGAFDKYKEPLDQLQIRSTGIGLDMVHAQAFDTPHGRYEGGYYPIVEDKSRSDRADKQAEKASADTMFPNNYSRATTPHGNTISRVGGDRPISIDLDIAPWKIGQTIHDIAMREAIMDSDRLLNHPDVIKAMSDVFGKEYQKLLRPWLQTLANARNIDDAALSFANRMINTVKTNTVIVGVGFRAMTMVKHGTTALSNSLSELGTKWMLAGTKEFYGPGMNAKWDFIKSKSPDMAFRLKHYDQDVNSQYSNLFKDSNFTKFQQQAQYFGHIGISYLDLGSAAPTWLGAYRKGLSENMADADAVYYADKTVRNAHGGTGLTDRSAVQEVKGPWSLATMFYGFFNHIYNRQRSIAIQGAEGVKNMKAGEYKQASSNFAGVLARSWYYVAVPAFIEALAQNSGPNQDKEESWSGWAAKAIMSEIPAGLPVLRDIAKAAVEGRDYTMSPVATAINTGLHAYEDLVKTWTEGEAPKNTAKHVAEAAGYATGLPTAAPFTAGKFLWDYSDGSVDPHSLSEWIQGLLHGKIAEH